MTEKAAFGLNVVKNLFIVAGLMVVGTGLYRAGELAVEAFNEFRLPCDQEIQNRLCAPRTSQVETTIALPSLKNV